MKVFNFNDGRAFEPDYLLFGLDHKGRGINYQIFLEAKGPHLAEHDKWKQDFLEEISKRIGKQALKFKMHPAVKNIDRAAIGIVSRIG